VELEEAIRGRRTHKVYGQEPVDRELLEQLFDLARWAPNHHLTNPWRFRVLGPESLARLKACATPDAAVKFDRAPTLVCASVKLSGDAVQDEEDVCAVACAVFIVLLAAHDRGLAGYWRTPGVLRTPDGAAAVGMEPDELFVGLIHLGPARQDKSPPERLPPADFVSWLP
jgi:nitroreductase